MSIEEIDKSINGLEDLGSLNEWDQDQSLQFYQALFLGEIARQLALFNREYRDSKRGWK